MSTGFLPAFRIDSVNVRRSMLRGIGLLFAPCNSATARDAYAPLDVRRYSKMQAGNRISWGIGVFGACLLWACAQQALGQSTRGPRDFLDNNQSEDQYGHRYRSQVFDDDPYHVDHSVDDESPRGNYRARATRSARNSEERGSFSGAYPYAPRVREPREQEEQEPFRQPARRYRRPDGVVRNDYANAPVYRHYYGGVDRYDSPGYLDDAGRASAISNGYSRRGVEEFNSAYGGIRLNDVYPLQRNVDPRRYRGRFLNGNVSADNEDTSGADELEDFVRSELSVRPGANLRVSSTGTYTYRNYIDQGNQVHARFRQPIHKKWQFGRGP
jgi:hypothetical protein